MSSIQYKQNSKTGTEIQKREHTRMLSYNSICVGRILSLKPLQLSKLSASGCLNPISGESNERPTWEHLLNNRHKLITNYKLLYITQMILHEVNNNTITSKTFQKSRPRVLYLENKYLWKLYSSVEINYELILWYLNRFHSKIFIHFF